MCIHRRYLHTCDCTVIPFNAAPLRKCSVEEQRLADGLPDRCLRLHSHPIHTVRLTTPCGRTECPTQTARAQSSKHKLGEAKKIIELIRRREFGMASGGHEDGGGDEEEMEKRKGSVRVEMGTAKTQYFPKLAGVEF